MRIAYSSERASHEEHSEAQPRIAAVQKKHRKYSSISRRRVSHLRESPATFPMSKAPCASSEVPSMLTGTSCACCTDGVPCRESPRGQKQHGRGDAGTLGARIREWAPNQTEDERAKSLARRCLLSDRDLHRIVCRSCLCSLQGSLTPQPSCTLSVIRSAVYLPR